MRILRLSRGGAAQCQPGASRLHIRAAGERRRRTGHRIRRQIWRQSFVNRDHLVRQVHLRRHYPRWNRHPKQHRRAALEVLMNPDHIPAIGACSAADDPQPQSRTVGIRQLGLCPSAQKIGIGLRNQIESPAFPVIGKNFAPGLVEFEQDHSRVRVPDKTLDPGGGNDTFTAGDGRHMMQRRRGVGNRATGVKLDRILASQRLGNKFAPLIIRGVIQKYRRGHVASQWRIKHHDGIIDMGSVFVSRRVMADKGRRNAKWMHRRAEHRIFLESLRNLLLHIAESWRGNGLRIALDAAGVPAGCCGPVLKRQFGDNTPDSLKRPRVNNVWNT